MKRILAPAAGLLLGAMPALAGGIDQSGQSVGIIFEKGRYAEFTFGTLAPTISGVGSAFTTPGVASGDMRPSSQQYGFAYKQDLSDALSLALIYDQPFGADVNYPTGTGYFAAGSTAELNTNAFTGVLKYTLPSNISVYGGLRYQMLEAQATIPFIAGYGVLGAQDGNVGYLLGAAYEKPEIALRVALTYNSRIEHNLATTETSGALGGPNQSVTSFDTPQSVNLEFQSGIAEDTLLFGSVRWVEWSEFAITPADYFVLTSGGSLVSYNDDRVTYTLGVGRRLNENWSVAGSLGYEAQAGGLTSNLGPVDGFANVGLGATYTRDNMKITGGVRYIEIGNATTNVGGAPGGIFTGNTAIAAGVKVGFSF